MDEAACAAATDFRFRFRRDGSSSREVCPPPPLRILYTSDWAQTTQIYAVDASKLRHGQLTFGAAPACQPGHPCGYVLAAPSPDGRYVVFRDYANQGRRPASLYLARANGLGRRRLTTVEHFALTPASWAPDSARVAYVDSAGISVLRVDSPKTRRLVAATHGLPTALAWSPDGGWIAYEDDGVRLVRPNGTRLRTLTVGDVHVADLSWSPDGRRLAVATAALLVVDVRTDAVRQLAPTRASRVAWSPDGRSIGFLADAALTIADIGSGAQRILAHDAKVASLAWSPDGRNLAYVGDTGDLRVVDLHGNARTLVDAGGDYGGSITDVVWTRAAAGTTYRSAAPRTLASVTPGELTAARPIQRLAADGPRVAFAVCGHAFAWTPATRVVEQAEAVASLAPRCSTPKPYDNSTYYDSRYVYSVAIAGDRVALGLAGGGNSGFWWLNGARLDPGRTGFVLGQNSRTRGCGWGDDVVGDLVGSGSLLAFSSRDSVPWVSGPRCPARVTRQSVIRAEAGDCPCPTIAEEPGPFDPLDADAGRILAAGDNAVVLLDPDGKRLLTVPIRALGAQLAGRDLVVVTGQELRDYDAATGELLRAWPLPATPGAGECSMPDGCPYIEPTRRFVLQDAARGAVAYVLDGRVHVLRLSDGADAIVAPGTLARFMDAGLVLADDARLRLFTWDRLPLR